MGKDLKESAVAEVESVKVCFPETSPYLIPQELLSKAIGIVAKAQMSKKKEREKKTHLVQELFSLLEHLAGIISPRCPGTLLVFRCVLVLSTPPPPETQ